MQIAIVLFDRFTALDAVGPYETLGRLPDAELVFVAEETGPVRSDTGALALTADRKLAEVPSPDVVVVPGGPGQFAQMENETLFEWAPGSSKDAGPPRTGWRWISSSSTAPSRRGSGS